MRRCAKLVDRAKIENAENIIKKLDLKKIDKKNYFEKSFNFGIPQINLAKLKQSCKQHLFNKGSVRPYLKVLFKLLYKLKKLKKQQLFQKELPIF